ATATRNPSAIKLGASPRASLQLLKAAKAAAAMDGRDYVLPDDLQALAVPVLAHRLILTTEARLTGKTPSSVMAEIVARIPVPAAE
ncbi:MAG: ATPase, partial [Promicromonosporaceae bacterium]|nr:ATPase [Promicromonosporaceae bacterium]